MCEKHWLQTGDGFDGWRPTRPVRFPTGPEAAKVSQGVLMEADHGREFFFGEALTPSSGFKLVEQRADTSSVHGGAI